MEQHKIKKYKDVDLFYNESNGKIYFTFEGIERNVKYVFEAEEIIDKPVWDECNMEGFFVDGYVDKYIGLAKAERINRKTGIPDWKIKGRYDSEYKNKSYNDNHKIYSKNKYNKIICEKWKKQKEIYTDELIRLNNITDELKQTIINMPKLNHNKTEREILICEDCLMEVRSCYCRTESIQWKIYHNCLECDKNDFTSNGGLKTIKAILVNESYYTIIKQ